MTSQHADKVRQRQHQAHQRQNDHAQQALSPIYQHARCIQSRPQTYHRQEVLDIPWENTRYSHFGDFAHTTDISTDSSQRLLNLELSSQYAPLDISIGMSPESSLRTMDLDMNYHSEATRPCLLSTRWLSNVNLQQGSACYQASQPSELELQNTNRLVVSGQPEDLFAENEPIKSCQSVTNSTTGFPKSEHGGSVPAESRKGSGDRAKPPNRRCYRQRIPHTVVERRYRENLNAHIESLRQKVPSLVSHRVARGVPLVVNTKASSVTDHHSDRAYTTLSSLADVTRPSKCEILKGAIHYIYAIEQENEIARAEIRRLKARLSEIQRWYDAVLWSANTNDSV